MRSFRIEIGLILLLVIFQSCASVSEIQKSKERIAELKIEAPPSLEVKKSKSDILTLAKNIPDNATSADLGKRLDDILPAINSSTYYDIESIEQTIAILAKQPNSVKALSIKYHDLPETDYSQRIFILGVLGELKRSDSMDFLQSIVWEPLPAQQDVPEGFSHRDYSEMMQVKAVHGIAYLHTDEALESTIRVMLNHESKSVRVAAIDAYMWNMNDDKGSAERLYKLLPENMHMFVEMPRFYRGMNVIEFNNRVINWRKKWANTKDKVISK